MLPEKEMFFKLQCCQHAFSLSDTLVSILQKEIDALYPLSSPASLFAVRWRPFFTSIPLPASTLFSLCLTGSWCHRKISNPRLSPDVRKEQESSGTFKTNNICGRSFWESQLTSKEPAQKGAVTQKNPPIIPTLDHLKELADVQDKQIIEGQDCTFVSNLNKIQPTGNTQSLDVLLGDFFEYFGNFAFNKYSLNIRKGKEQSKPESSPLHIQNPFEQSLNISKNVNAMQLERFVNLARESAWILQEDKGPSSTSSQPWGMAALLPASAANHASKGTRKKGRGYTSERIKGLLDSLKLNNPSNGKKPFSSWVR